MSTLSPHPSKTSSAFPAPIFSSDMTTPELYDPLAFSYIPTDGKTQISASDSTSSLSSFASKRDPVPLTLPLDRNSPSYFFSYTPGQTDDSAYQPGEQILFYLPDVAIIRTSSCPHEDSKPDTALSEYDPTQIPTLSQENLTSSLSSDTIIRETLPSPIDPSSPTPHPDTSASSSTSSLSSSTTVPPAAAVPPSLTWWSPLALMTSATSAATSAVSHALRSIYTYFAPPPLPLPTHYPFALVLTTTRIIIAIDGRAEYSLPLTAVLGIHAAHTPTEGKTTVPQWTHQKLLQRLQHH